MVTFICCSECEAEFDIEPLDDHEIKFCPACGAEVEVEEEDETEEDDDS